MYAKYYHTSKIVLFSFLGLVWLLTSGPAVAGDDVIENFWSDVYSNIPQPSAPQEDPQYILWKRLAKAKPDECYFGMGNHTDSINSFNSIYPGDMTSTEFEACSKAGHIPKVNQAYVWGLTKQGDNLWFGTVANTLCLAVAMAGLGLPPMQVDKDWVCEVGPDGSWDLRPPRIFVYNVEYKTLEDQTNKVRAKSDADKDLLEATTGLRSAGNNGGVVFLGGISDNGVNLFAFNASTKAYLGSMNYPNLNNIRQWRVIKSQLYVGVGKPGGGEIWRWTGSLSKYKLSKNLADIFKFEIVGDLKADPAYLAVHKDRIFVSTWADISDPNALPVPQLLYMSPPFGSDNRLGSADKNGWKVVWRWTDYEVEPAALVLGGGLASYGGYLYWGTMTIPGIGLQLMNYVHPTCPPLPPDPTTAPIPTLEAFFGTYRPIHVFRGSDFGKTTPPKIELLYGLPKLPTLDDDSCKWKIVPNKMGKAPKFGLAGMNNFFNTYTWWMEPFQNRLFVGTFDWLYLAVAVVQELAGVDLPESYKKLAQHFEGADLFSFKSTYERAFPASMNGLGNYLNYGIRTMVADPDYLYLGTANAMNLATDPTDKKTEGGWELYKLGIRNECCTSEDSCYNPCY